MKSRLIPVLLTLAACLFPACTPPKFSTRAPSPSALATPGPRLVSDTLYFGTDSPRGPVTPAKWNSFLSRVVTQRFPDGLTVWDAEGQWKGKNGIVGSEKTKVLLLVHPESSPSDRAIQEIIDIYKKEFSQESVMKVRTPADVSF